MMDGMVQRGKSSRGTILLILLTDISKHIYWHIPLNFSPRNFFFRKQNICYVDFIKTLIEIIKWHAFDVAGEEIEASFERSDSFQFQNRLF